MKLEDCVKNQKHLGYPVNSMPKRNCALETFEKWFCDEFHIKPIEVAKEL